MAVRFDISNTLPAAEKLPDGRLRASAFLTRSGVFSYRAPDGTTRREYRPPSEVFDAASLRSFEMAPVTDDHPPGLLTAKTARKYAVGSVGEIVRQDGDHVAATLMVVDEDVIAKMDAGKRQVSCGYTCELDMTPGVTPDGERYDAIQRKIRGNHAAIVDIGRAGPSARVHLDSETVERWDSAEMVADETETTKVETMDELTKALADLAAATLRADTAEKAIAELSARADKAEAERDSERAARELADKARADEAERLPQLVKARVALETKAIQALGADAKLDGMSDRDIRMAVVKKLDKVEIEATRSDDYVTAYFDSAVERALRSDAANASLRSVADAPRADVADAKSARDKMINSNREIWKA